MAEKLDINDIETILDSDSSTPKYEDVDDSKIPEFVVFQLNRLVDPLLEVEIPQFKAETVLDRYSRVQCTQCGLASDNKDEHIKTCPRNSFWICKFASDALIASSCADVSIMIDKRIFLLEFRQFNHVFTQMYEMLYSYQIENVEKFRQWTPIEMILWDRTITVSCPDVEYKGRYNVPTYAPLTAADYHPKHESDQTIVTSLVKMVNEMKLKASREPEADTFTFDDDDQVAPTTWKSWLGTNFGKSTYDMLIAIKNTTK